MVVDRSGWKRAVCTSGLPTLSLIPIPMSELIDAILEWAEDHPEFDPSFVISVSDWCAEHEITSRQEEALQRIYERFRIGASRQGRPRKRSKVCG